MWGVAWRPESQNFEVGSTQSSNRNPTVYGQGTEKMDPCGPESMRPSSFFSSSFLFSPGFVLKPVLVADLYCCGDNVAGSVSTWTLFLWLVELGKGIPVCKQCRRSPHYIFFSLLPLKGGSSDTELYDSVVVCVCGGGQWIKVWEKSIFLAKQIGKRGPCEPEIVEKIPERRELDKGIPLILCMNWHKSWAHPQVVHEEHRHKRFRGKSLGTELWYKVLPSPKHTLECHIYWDNINSGIESWSDIWTTAHRKWDKTCGLNLTVLISC